MDMKIAGSGTVSAGEYNKIDISGAGKLTGHVRCDSFDVSGAVNGISVECSGDLDISGSGTFSDFVTADSIEVSGSFKCGGDLKAYEDIRFSGGAKCEGNVNCANLRVDGRSSVHGDIEAESVLIDGAVNCDGLINAEEITIKYHSGMEIGSIGGSRIVITKAGASKSKVTILRLPLFSSITSSSSSMVRINNAIEGDNIAIEGTSAERVSGRIVAIGKGCKIDLVQYSEEIEISPNAEVGRCERI